jgi:hypothetical protein
MQVSQAVTIDYPDLKLSTGLEIIAGLLYVPLSSGGKDFIAFLRKGQPREVHWAGKPFKPGGAEKASLEPRVSFKSWSQIVAGRARVWTDEQLETAGVLALVYGKVVLLAKYPFPRPLTCATVHRSLAAERDCASVHEAHQPPFVKRQSRR